MTKSDAIKGVAKDATTAAFEKTVLSFLPGLQSMLDGLRTDIARLDGKIDHLREDMYDKFEQQRNVINELGQRISHVEGKLEAVSDSINRQSDRINRQTDKMDQWIERVVRIETAQRSSGRMLGRLQYFSASSASLR